MHEIDLSKYEIRTDLIGEYLKDNNTIKKDLREISDIKIETIIITEEKEKIINKKAGTYKTITFNDITDENNYNNLLKVVIPEIKDILLKNNIKDEDSCLIIGLGNRNSTPDSLGPLTIDNIKITRQIIELNLELDNKYRIISALAPSVMGLTGIETKDIIMGVVDKIKPNFLIVIDSLASSSIERINKTIQITDTGISPGSGLLNNRKEISKDTIKIPVIAIGVPTVVSASIIVSNTINYIFNHFSYEKENINNQKNKLILPNDKNYKFQKNNLTKQEKKQIMGLVGSLNEDELKSLIKEVLTPLGYNLLVTTKEIDDVMTNLSKLIGQALNESLLIE